MKLWRKTKLGIRRGIYALIDTVDPLWWGVLMIIEPIIAAVVWGQAGFWISVGVVVLMAVFVWLVVDDDSLEATTAALKRTQCLPNIAEVSYRNAMDDGHQ